MAENRFERRASAVYGSQWERRLLGRTPGRIDSSGRTSTHRTSSGASGSPSPGRDHPEDTATTTVTIAKYRNKQPGTIKARHRWFSLSDDRGSSRSRCLTKDVALKNLWRWRAMERKGSRCTGRTAVGTRGRRGLRLKPPAGLLDPHVWGIEFAIRATVRSFQSPYPARQPARRPALRRPPCRIGEFRADFDMGQGAGQLVLSIGMSCSRASSMIFADGAT